MVDANDPKSTIREVLGYHEQSKHRFGRFARGPRALDWSNQPSPFRRYRGAALLALDHVPPSPEPRYGAALVAGSVPARALDRSSLSQLFADSLALSAWKRAGETSWSLRVNPSSGNLHPTEGYLVCDAIDGLCHRPIVGHYAPKQHALERRCEFDPSIWRELSIGFPESTVLVGLTSIHWREAWKYGERGYRYCQHDIGHAIAAMAIAASGLGWQATLLDELGTDEVAGLLGVAQASGPEAEVADCMLAIHAQGESVPRRLPSATLDRFTRLAWTGEAVALSPDHVHWPSIDRVATAATKPRSLPDPNPNDPQGPAHVYDAEPVGLREVIRARRSAVAFNGRTGMTREGFEHMLYRVSVRPNQFPFNALPWRPRIDLALFVHRVADLDPGLYLLVRDPERLERLRSAMNSDFAWQPAPGFPEDMGLYLLERGDAREVSAQVACAQDIAADGCFALGMIADFEGPIRTLGAWVYPRLFWECGVIGQALYLEAESLGLRGTGIGCFFDEPMSGVLGLRGRAFQSLYHFTVGAAVEDTRIQSSPAYVSQSRASTLSGLKLRLSAEHARLRFSDGSHADLEGSRVATAIAAAAPLIGYLEARCGSGLRAISVDLRARVLRVTYDSSSGVDTLRIDGAPFEEQILPRCAEVFAAVTVASARATPEA